MATVSLIRVKAEREVVAAMKRWCESEIRYGIDDCMLAVADTVKAIKGFDLADEFRGKYHDKTGAYRAMGRGGARAVVKRVSEDHGFEAVSPGEAKPGDIGVAVVSVTKTKSRYRRNYGAVICRKQGWFVARAERGFVGIPAGHVKAAWSIT